MILQCPNCNARFMVADSMIPPAGRTVRCGKCTHQWFTEGPAADFAAMANAFSGGAGVLPALAHHHVPMLPLKLAVPFLALLWIVIAIYAYFPGGQHTAVFGGIYRMLGAADTRGLVFENVTMEREQIGGKTRYVLAGAIANHEAKKLTAPYVRIRLKSTKGEVVWEREYPVNQELEPGEVYPFRIEDVETAFANKVATIVLDLGNGFEIGARE